MRKLFLVSLTLFLAGCGKTPEYSVPALTELLKHQDPAMRSYAARHLHKFGSKAASAVPALIEALKDEDANVRSGACYSLALIGSAAQPAVPALKELLNDSDAGVRKGAAYAVKRLENPSAKVVSDSHSKPGVHKHRRHRDTGQQTQDSDGL
jgi:HEAT repeat protein